MITVPALLARLVAVAFVLAVVQAAWNAAQLPALSAAWFDAAGRPLWFVPTTRLAWAHVGVAALAAIATAVGLHRAHARAAWRVAALGLATLLALAVLAQQVYDANRAAIPRLAVGAVLATGAVYGAFVTAWSLTGRRRPSRER